MSKGLAEMALNAETLEQVEEVVSSEKYREANGLQVSLANSILGFTVLRLRLDRIENELVALRKAVEAIEGEK